MNEVKNKRLTPYARRLRKEMTPEEKRLWYDFLKKLPWTVNRQKVFGKYIVDFYIAAASLVIEVDGGQHLGEEALQRDRERDRWLQERGVTVLRYPNLDVKLDFDRVCIDILQHLPLLPAPQIDPDD